MLAFLSRRPLVGEKFSGDIGRKDVNRRSVTLAAFRDEPRPTQKKIIKKTPNNTKKKKIFVK